MTGPACGNNPNYRMSDGDRRVVDSFRAYLTARGALRDRIAAALYDHSHPGWAISFPDLDQEQRDTYLARADAVLAVLPAPVDRAAVLRDAADEIAGIDFHPNARARSLDIAAGLARRLRCMADETAATETGPIVQATRYTVNCLPEDGIDSHVFEITVEYRGADRWAVKRHSQCLAADGTWDYEMRPSEREDEWLDAHRFDLDTALHLAKEAAPKVTVNGITVTEALRRANAAGTRQDEAQP
jgi:hypothetical protein